MKCIMRPLILKQFVVYNNSEKFLFKIPPIIVAMVVHTKIYNKGNFKFLNSDAHENFSDSLETLYYITSTNGTAYKNGILDYYNSVKDKDCLLFVSGNAFHITEIRKTFISVKMTEKIISLVNL